MRFFGIDPGSRVTGYGVILAEGNRYRCLDYGTISTVSGKKKVPLPERLVKIYQGLKERIAHHQPDAVIVEEVFHAVNTKTALALGQARGVILLAAATQGIEVFEYSPLKVKQSVVGYGRAEKQQVQMMVKRLLNLTEEPEPHDAADALAIALCHAFNRSPVQRSQPR
jgi:crossover junction endodeoxyribonuclease RuvC